MIKFAKKQMNMVQDVMINSFSGKTVRDLQRAWDALTMPFSLEAVNNVMEPYA